MKIALINTRVEARQHPPLGTLYVAGGIEKALPNQHEIIVFDPEVDDVEFQDIIRFKPDVIGISFFTQGYIRARSIIKRLKESLPHAFYIAGGIHATVQPGQVLDEMGMDCVVLGEGEFTAPKIIEAISRKQDLGGIPGIAYRKNGQTVVVPRAPLNPDLNSYPFPAYHLMPDFKKYLIPPGFMRGEWNKRMTIVMAGRGCPFQCIFCDSHSLFGRKVRWRSPANVILELTQLKNKYDIDAIWFADDTFTANKKWTVEFCKALIESGIKLKWSCQVRADTVNLDTLVMMKKAGCAQVEVGVESGSDRVLKTLKKGITPSDVINAFDLIHQAGIRAMATFIIGNPGEELEDINKTRQLIKRIKPDFMNVFTLMAYPGTELYAMAEENNWWVRKDYDDPLGVQGKSMLHIKFSPEELARMRTEITNDFQFKYMMNYLRNFRFVLGISKIFLRHPDYLFRTLRHYLRTRSFYDSMYFFLQTYRINYFKKAPAS